VHYDSAIFSGFSGTLLCILDDGFWGTAQVWHFSTLAWFSLHCRAFEVEILLPILLNWVVVSFQIGWNHHLVNHSPRLLFVLPQPIKGMGMNGHECMTVFGHNGMGHISRFVEATCGDGGDRCSLGFQVSSLKDGHFRRIPIIWCSKDLVDVPNTLQGRFSFLCISGYESQFGINTSTHFSMGGPRVTCVTGKVLERCHLQDWHW